MPQSSRVSLSRQCGSRFLIQVSSLLPLKGKSWLPPQVTDSTNEFGAYMGASSSQPLAADAVIVSLDVKNKQEYYTGGESITGDVVVECQESDTLLTSLTVTLSCTARAWALRCRPPTVYLPYEDVKLVSESTILGAGRHRFPFTVRTPSDATKHPPSIVEVCVHRHGYSIAWSMAVQLNAILPGISRSVNRTDSLPVTVFPALPNLQGIFRVQQLSHITPDPYLRVRLECPEGIPQAPDPCAMNLTVNTYGQFYVKTVEVYLKRTTVLWTNLHARMKFAKFPIGYVVVRQQSRDLRFSGADLGWGLKSIEPEAFVFASFCISYSMCIVVRLSDGDSVETEFRNMRMAPPRPLEGKEGAQGLPPYSEKGCAGPNGVF